MKQKFSKIKEIAPKQEQFRWIYGQNPVVRRLLSVGEASVFGIPLGGIFFEHCADVSTDFVVVGFVEVGE